MRAIIVRRTGGPEVLEQTELPVPVPQPHEAVIRQEAVGVNFIDIYFREGRYSATLPFVPGQEGAGTVTQVGSGVKSVRVGDRVAYTGRLGAYAEFAAVPADRLVPIPPGLDARDAAAAMLQGMTAHYLTRSTYPLKGGETVLVHAAAGGVGRLLVQMAKQLGARVIGTAGTDAKAQVAREAGADEVIVYTRDDFEPETRRLTDGQGVDVVYDGVGKDTFDRDLNVLRPRGMLVLYGGSSGAVPPFDPIVLNRKGSLFLTRPNLAHYIATHEELEQRGAEVLGMVSSGALILHIDRTYALSAAAEAHRALESRATTGKLLLAP